MGVYYPFLDPNRFEFEPTGISTQFTGSYNPNAAINLSNGLNATGISTFNSGLNVTGISTFNSTVVVKNLFYTARTNGTTGDSRTLTLSNISEGSAFLLTIQRSPTLDAINSYTGIIAYDGLGNMDVQQDIAGTYPVPGLTITFNAASSGTATIDIVNGSTQRFRATAIRIG